MQITKLQVYDPPMCCPSGVCGPSVNPALPRFAADVEWLKRQGVQVERYSLSSQPAAFVQNQVVKDALESDGNDCLPLIVVNGLIVSKAVYPQRNDLMKLSGIDSAKVSMEATPVGTSNAEPGTGAPVCGPGCGCGTPSGNRKSKLAVSLLMLLAVASIFIYKASAAKNNASNNTPTQAPVAFAFAPPLPTTMPEAATQPSVLAMPEVAKADQKVGEYLESLSALNKVAIDQDAVFVFIPALKNDLADDKTNTAVLAAARTLKTAKITLGLYTLRSSSPEYAAISAQVQAPAILVATKGKGMTAVSGDVTETKLLQAFMTSSRAGGCGPASSGCGPASPACN